MQAVTEQYPPQALHLLSGELCGWSPMEEAKQMHGSDSAEEEEEEVVSPLESRGEWEHLT